MQLETTYLGADIYWRIDKCPKCGRMWRYCEDNPVWSGLDEVKKIYHLVGGMIRLELGEHIDFISEHKRKHSYWEEPYEERGYIWCSICGARILKP